MQKVNNAFVDEPDHGKQEKLGPGKVKTGKGGCSTVLGFGGKVGGLGLETRVQWDGLVNQPDHKP